MDRIRWSIYGYSAMFVGVAAIAGAAVLSSWQLAVAGAMVVALGVIVLGFREVDPEERDDRFGEITGSRVATVISLAGLLGLWVLSARRGGLWLVFPVVFSALALRRLVQSGRTRASGTR